MLYDLIETYRGKDTVLMRDSLPKVNNRLKALRNSKAKGRLFRIEKSKSLERIMVKRNVDNYQAGGYSTQPPKIKD